MTEVRLSQAAATELRAIYAAPCWQGPHWGGDGAMTLLDATPAHSGGDKWPGAG